MQRLKGKNALITGASSGIGEAIALRFGQEGANVAINYYSGADRAEAVKAKLREAAKANRDEHKSITVKANISDEAEIKQMFATVVKEFGTLDILVNNSGIQMPVPSDL